MQTFSSYSSATSGRIGGSITPLPTPLHSCPPPPDGSALAHYLSRLADSARFSHRLPSACTSNSRLPAPPTGWCHSERGLSLFSPTSWQLHSPDLPLGLRAALSGVFGRAELLVSPCVGCPMHQLAPRRGLTALHHRRPPPLSCVPSPSARPPLSALRFPLSFRPSAVRRPQSAVRRPQSTRPQSAVRSPPSAVRRSPLVGPRRAEQHPLFRHRRVGTGRRRSRRASGRRSRRASRRSAAQVAVCRDACQSQHSALRAAGRRTESSPAAAGRGRDGLGTRPRRAASAARRCCFLTK